MNGPNLSKLELKTHYWDDPPAKHSFIRFLNDIHDLDLSDWDELGQWDSSYTPFSYFYEDEIVSSVCIYLLDALILGKPAHLAQISGVGTHPAWRNRGLNRELTQLALSQVRKTIQGVFLFADVEAIPYYQKTGFTAFEEFLEFITIAPLPSRPGTHKLKPHNLKNLKKIVTLAERRDPISNSLSVMNPKLVAFHTLYTLKDCAYEIPDLDCIVFFRRAGETLKIYDILAPALPPFLELYPYLCDPGDRIVEFHFHTDKLAVQGVQQRRLEGGNPFILDHFPLGNVVFPFTSRA